MFFNKRELEDIHYTCSMIKYISEETSNKPSDIVRYLAPYGIKWLLENASSCHCLDFELMSERLIDKFGIKKGHAEQRKRILSYIDTGEIYKVIAVGLSYDYHLPIVKAIQEAFSFDCPV